MTTEVARAPSSPDAPPYLRRRAATADSLPASTVPGAIVAVAILLIVGASMLVGPIGADARWLAALGHTIVSQGWVPSGVPFAVAPSGHWHNVTAVGEVVLWGLEAAFGDRGLAIAQGLAVGVAFSLLAIDARRAGGRPQAIASTCLIVAGGAAASLAITRAQLFSLPCFALLLLLLRADSRRRSWRVAWVVPLLAVWSNLHGAVLVGLAITLAYLVVDRFRDRPFETVALGVACTAALFANAGGLHAFAYYQGVLHNEAAQRGEGMWGALTPLSVSGALVIVALIALLVRSVRARPRGWEIVVVLLLAAMTLHATRSSVWLLFVLVAPAARGARAGRPWRRRTALVAGLALATLGLAMVRGPVPSGASAGLLRQAIARAAGTPILASDIAAEQVALAGGKVWLSNPIDAFPASAQAAYLDFLDGRPSGLQAARAAVRVVLVRRGSPEAALMGASPGFAVVGHDDSYLMFAQPSR